MNTRMAGQEDAAPHPMDPLGPGKPGKAGPGGELGPGRAHTAETPQGWRRDFICFALCTQSLRVSGQLCSGDTAVLRFGEENVNETITVTLSENQLLE